MSGATPAERLIDAARRNNVDLFEQFAADAGTPEEAIELINTATDPSGNSALHLAAKYGNYEVMDLMLDIDGVDVNVVSKMNGNTPLHYAVSYAFEDAEYALFMTNELINCGADPNIKNKEGLKPVDIIGTANEPIKEALEAAAYANAFDAPIEDIEDIDEDYDGEEEEDEEEEKAEETEPAKNSS